MILRYEYECGPSVYDEENDEVYDDFRTFSYEPKDSDIEYAMSEILADLIVEKIKLGKIVVDKRDLLKIVQKTVRYMLRNFTIEQEGNSIEEEYRAELEEYFEQEAFESRKE